MKLTLKASKGLMNFELFYNTQKDKALSYLQGRGMNREDAEDVFEEAIIAFLSKDPRTEDRYFSNSDCALLFSIYKNQGFNKFRYLSRHATFSLDLFLEDVKDQDLEEGAYASFSGETVEDENWSYVEEALSQLSEKDQQILNLYYCEELSMKQISNKLGYKSETVVRSQKCRAMRQLKESILRLKYRFAA